MNTINQLLLMPVKQAIKCPDYWRQHSLFQARRFTYVKKIRKLILKILKIILRLLLSALRQVEKILDVLRQWSSIRFWEDPEDEATGRKGQKAKYQIVKVGKNRAEQNEIGKKGAAKSEIDD